MLPQKKDAGLLSVPVSRVASSQRLSPLAGTPAPSTPYVPSSLNPAHAPTPTTSALDGLPVFSQVRQFEEELALLSRDVSSFRDDDDRIQQTVRRLIELNDAIFGEISQLAVHQQLGDRIGALERDKRQLDAAARGALVQLIEYRAQLRRLPRAAAHPSPLVDVKEILKYAMKLSKFTRVPPSAVGQQVHPNNYIWPAEDALRRGMLAVSSLRGDELIADELGDAAVTGATPVAPAASEAPSATPASPAAPAATPASPAAPAAAARAPRPAPALDLDLFDPDNDD
ncbi:Mediator of RNA polymerase II transcription subunit 4 [[Candida] zeylanoides]